MDYELARLQRMLRASGQRFKVLDARSIDLLTGFFKKELQQAQIALRRARYPQAKATAFERLNNITSTMELFL